MDMASALTDLGVRPLDPEVAGQLDRDGFAPLPGVLSEAQMDAIRARLAELTEEEGDRAGLEVHQEAGTDRLSDLVNKDPIFDVCFTHPLVLAAMAHVLGEFKLSSLNYRSALPGKGLQGLHADWGRRAAGDGFNVCNSIWLLDDFTADNGATRVVPGSHLRPELPQDALADPAAPHPEQVQLLAPAGTVVIFNSHAWHGGTLNSSDKPRRALHSYFTRRENGQQLDQRRYVRESTMARLSPAARFVLDV